MSRLSQNIISYSGAIALQKIISFFYFTLIARSLGPTLAGTYFLGFSLVQLFAAFVDLGFGNYLIREVAQDRIKAQAVFRYVWGVKLILSVLGFIGVVVSAVVLQYPTVVIAITIVAGVALVIDSLSAINYSALRGHQILQAESIGIVAYQVALATIGTIIITTTGNLVLLASASVLASAVHFLISARYLKRTTEYRMKPMFEKQKLMMVLKHSLPFAFIMLFGRLYTQTDIIMLSKIGCHARDCIHDVGLYTTAVKATLVIQSIPLSFMASVYPALSESFARQSERFKELFMNTSRYMIAGIVGVVVLFWVFGGSAVVMVWGNEFMGSVWSLNVLLLGSIFVIASFPCAAALNSAHRQKSYALFALLGLLVNVIANIFLIPRFGIVGAAGASVIGSVVLLACSWWAMEQIVSKTFTNGLSLLIRIGVVGFVTFLITRFTFGSLHVVLGTALSGLVYGVLLVATQVIHVSEVKALIDNLRRLKKEEGKI